MLSAANGSVLGGGAEGGRTGRLARNYCVEVKDATDSEQTPEKCCTSRCQPAGGEGKIEIEIGIALHVACAAS